MENCLYCESIIFNTSKEHVLPNAIGGTATIKGVCKACNNGLLSQLDEQLCSFSPLSIIASQELKDSSIHGFWATDLTANGLLVESFFDVSSGSPVAYPQLIVEPNHYHLRAPLEDMKRIGATAMKKLLIRRLTEAFEQNEFRIVARTSIRSKPLIINQKLDSSLIPKDRRFPPRFFFKCNLTELANKSSTLILRYSEDRDLKMAYNRLSKLRYTSTFRRSAEVWISQVASIKIEFIQNMISRALMKISLNAIKYLVDKTTINKTSFKETIEIIRGDIVNDKYIKQVSGFISPFEATIMKTKFDEHKLWIIRKKEYWEVFISFFGGRIVSKSILKGTSNEEWNFAELTVPIKSNKIKVEKYCLYPPPINASIAWDRLEDIIPSAKLSEGRFEEKIIRKVIKQK